MIGYLRRKIRQRIGASSFSQCGEDLILKYIFKSRGVDRPNYLDIGAYHPFILSNTQLFYKNGSVGVNIEPNSTRFMEFVKCRNRDTNLNIGVGVNSGKFTYYEFFDPTLNTFSIDEVNNYKKLHSETGLRKYRLICSKDVEMINVNGILEHYFSKGLDLLTIDAEGMDFEILKAIDFERFLIKILCVESVEHSANGLGRKRDEIVEYLAVKDYQEIAFTGLNSIFIRKDFWIGS